MSFRGFLPSRAGRHSRIALLIAAIGCVGLALPATSSASVLAPWGSTLSVPSSLDTANGASTQSTNEEPAGLFYGNGTDQAITTNFSPPCTRAFPNGPNQVQYLPCSNWTKDGADLSVWNTQVSGGTATAPAGGQILAASVKGCTAQDPTAPVQYSQAPGQPAVPVGSIEFQDLTPNGDGSFTSHATAGIFELPFCSPYGPADANTVTTFQPIHLCVNQHDIVGIFQSGGFIPSGTNGASGGPWYPQGAPVMIMAPVPGSGMDSFADADLPNKSPTPTYAPGAQPAGNNSGWGQESNQEVQLQVIEGTGDNAYGQCPGGNAIEPGNSNAVVCIDHPNPSPPFGTCNAQNQPIFPPQASGPPTISVSTNGTPVTGSPLPGDRVDMAHGSWSNSPYGYHEQWLDCDSTGNNCSAISGATNPYYYVTSTDVGHTIEVAESALNDAAPNGTASVNAPPTQVVGGPNVPVISVLKLNPSTWNEAGSSVITYYDSDASSTTIKVLQGTTVVKTLAHKDTAEQYGGNGISLTGLPAGNYQLQVTANNGGGVGPTQVLSFTVTSAAPVITNLHVNPNTFNAARGATITYSDSQSANDTLRVLRCQSLRNKKNKRAKKKHGKRRTANACATPKAIKTLHHQDRAGDNGVKLKGVPAGHYQLQIVSTYSGYRGTPVKTPFTAKLVHTKRHGVRVARDQLASALVIA